MKELKLFEVAIHPAVYMPILYLVMVGVLFGIKKLIFGRVRSFAKKSASGVDDILLDALGLPISMLILAAGIFTLDHLFQFGENQILAYVNSGFKAVAIIAVIIFVDRLLRNVISASSGRVKIIGQSKGVIQVFIRAVVFGLGALILLDSFGISITPVLASLGIGSLAVALALQPTLENFFSGIQLVADKPIAVGHFIKLDSGEEGYVVKIGWRSTWVRMIHNNVIVIPNKILVSTKILNYYYPAQDMSILVQVGVHYDSDLDHVEKVTKDVAKKTLEEVEGGVRDFEPFIRYHTFDSSSINFTVILRVNEFMEGYMVKHEFIKRLHKRYKEEGIVIPYPLVTLDWNDNSSPIKLNKD